MANSPLSGKSASTKKVLIGAFGCLIVAAMIGLIILGIFGSRIISGESFNLKNMVNISSDDGSSDTEGSAIDLLADDRLDSGEGGENQQAAEMADSGSEFAAVVLHPVGDLAGGYANIEWKEFLHIVAGNGYSPAQAETRSVFFDLTIDLGEGIFTGSAKGDLSGQEFLHKEEGSFTISGINGTVAENTAGSGYILEGTGSVNCQIEMVENYTDGAGNQYTYQRADEFSGQVDISGRLNLFSSTWELTLRGLFDNGTQSFHLNCMDCPVGVWEE